MPKGAETLLGPDANQPTVKLLSKMAGIRDLALGIATLDALRAKRPMRVLLAAGLVCDAVDLYESNRTKTLSSQSRMLFAGAAGPAVVLGAWLLTRRWPR